MIRALSVIVWLAAAQLATAVSAADSFPYTASVQAGDAYVRCGPGASFYPTDKLLRGDRVEVYRHDPNGWYAIRPPHGSFSWVDAADVYPTEERQGKVTRDGVEARVGTRLNDARDVIQVQLEEGEIVEIVGEQTVDGRHWYRIAPPAGEFRWIAARDLDPEAATANSKDDPARETPVANQLVSAEAPAGKADLSQRSSQEDQDATTTRSPANTAPPTGLSPVQEKPATEAASGEPQWKPQRASSVTQSSQGRDPVRAAPPEERRHTAESQTASSPSADRAPADKRTEPVVRPNATLDELDLQVSSIVAEEPSGWAFASIRQRAENLLDQAPTTAERNRVRQLLARISRYEEIQDRYDWLTLAQQEPNVQSRRPVPGTAPPYEDRGAYPAQYDGVGILRPVVSRRRNAPQFALVDREGGVISFVTPSPGVNLRPYVGRKVGLVGTRGFMPEYRRAHVTASRVTPLATSRFR